MIPYDIFNTVMYVSVCHYKKLTYCVSFYTIAVFEYLTEKLC